MSLRGLKQQIRRLAVLAVSTAVMLSAWAPKAMAYERPDIARKASLEIYCHKGDIAFGNVTFKAYKVADMNDLVRFSFSEQFKSYEGFVPIKDDMTNADWVSMADVLAGFVQRDQVQANRTSLTDESGCLKWEELETGLYLVIGEAFEREMVLDGYRTRIYYKPAPFLIALPSLVDDKWQYDLTVSPKSIPSQEGESSRRVLKVWDDAGYEWRRPEKLTFDLLRNGEVQETVELTADNNWRYQWDGLDNRYTWQIVEHTPDHYTVSASLQGITYVVTNRYRYGGSDSDSGSDDDYTPSPGPRPGGNSPGSEGGPGVIPPLEDIFDEATPLGFVPGAMISDGDIPRANWPLLPQTGQLWWPVPILSGAGMLIFAAGWLMRRKEHEN